MFNTFNTSTYVDITQQPNDAADSARLYGELKDKAIEDIEQVIFSKIPNTDISYASICRHYEEIDPTFTIIMKVNGEIVRNKISIDPFKSIHETDVVEEIAKSIGYSVLKQLSGSDIATLASSIKIPKK